MRTSSDASLIASLYEGCLDEAAWNRGIHQLTDRVGGASAALFGINPVTCNVFRAEPYGVSSEEMDEFGTNWAAHEIRIAPVCRFEPGEPIFDAKLMPTRIWKSSAIYNEFLLRIDRPWILSFWLEKGADKADLLTIHGGRHRGAFGDLDGARILHIIAHASRALRIRNTLAKNRLHITRLSHALNSAPYGVLILDASGCILEMNAAARVLMQKDSAIRAMPNGLLRFRAAADHELRSWIGAGTPPSSNRDGLIHVPREAGRRPISATLTPLRAEHFSLGRRASAWLVLLFDPEQRTAARAERIAAELRVSLREAEVVALLISGCHLPQVAAALRITVNTARTHLKAVFRKTGIHSQQELIRKFAGETQTAAGRGD
jgi:DNA-binding CsgD family transcriptional regulator